ncbi:patatin family protein [Dermacoccus nishinomiyaensis]|uniref:patatin-like phospholipase family protein n=2 Tax=Dermacoccaceae TaxID=145357 RepID=UPI0009F8DFEC|nr:patatin-like phospholipase family protein [Dermacoccus nishinomiyaensis]MBO1759385.1 patatin-like phospholipase family protein [Dermacoccus sp. NHGro5]TJZ95361.1 patatin family protein [Dermacoccus nishinomiyaensis]
MKTVLDVMRHRRDNSSQPLRRHDHARVTVVLEGGSSRAAYGGGMVAELEARDLLTTVDAVYGASAGALNGAWLICGRARANLHGWWAPESMNATIRPSNALRRKPVVDTDVIVYDLYENVTPMGFEEILASDVEYHPIATDAASGDAVDLAPMIHDKASLQDALRATARLPVLGGAPVEIDGRRFIDGGIAENIPVETALAQGATHVLVLRTKAPSLDLSPDKAVEKRLVARWMSRHAPGASAAWTRRNLRKQEIEHLMSHDDRVTQVAPPADVARISVVGRAQDVQRRAVQDGQRIMAETLDAAGL